MSRTSLPVVVAAWAGSSATAGFLFKAMKIREAAASPDGSARRDAVVAALRK